MDYSEVVNKSIKYIEENLFQTDVYTDTLTNIYISKYHFHRIFLLKTKNTLGDYIKKRRLTETLSLLEKENKVIDIAFDCGFKSHEAYTRAFKQYFGITPTNYKKNREINPLLKIEEMNPDFIEYLLENDLEAEIVTLEEVEFLGIKRSTTLENNKLAFIWQEFKKKIEPNTYEKIGYTLWLNHDNDLRDLGGNKEFEVFVGICNSELVANELDSFVVKKGLYAVFNTKKSIQHIYQIYSYIYFKWLSKSKYILRDGETIEKYNTNLTSMIDEIDITIYIPVK